MDDQAKKALQAIQELKPKTVAGQIRQLLPVIDEKIRAGVRIAEIVEVLSSAGIRINEGTLKSYLHRFRGGAKASKGSSGVASAPITDKEPQSVVGALAPPEMHESDGHPGALDRLISMEPEETASNVDKYENAWRQIRKDQQ